MYNQLQSRNRGTLVHLNYNNSFPAIRLYILLTYFILGYLITIESGLSNEYESTMVSCMMSMEYLSYSRSTTLPLNVSCDTNLVWYVVGVEWIDVKLNIHCFSSVNYVHLVNFDCHVPTSYSLKDWYLYLQIKVSDICFCRGIFNINVIQCYESFQKHYKYQKWSKQALSRYTKRKFDVISHVSIDAKESKIQFCTLLHH